MSTTEQQAAAQSETSQLTDAEKKRLLELQQKLDEAERQAGAPNPEGKPTDNENQLNTRRRAAFEAEREKNKQKAQALRQEFENVISNPVAASYAREHPATQYEIKRYAVSQTGYDPALQPDRARNKGDIDVRRTEMIEGIARANPSYSIQDINREYNIRSGNLNPPNVEIAYEATLAARQQGFNVGSGLTRNLPETFAKDEERRFGERNKFIGLTENVYTQKPEIPKQYFVELTEGKKSKTDYTVNLAEGITQRQAKSFGVSLTEGVPKKPRQLTQEQVNQLTPEQYAVYLAEYEAWNKYAKQKRTENFVSYKEQKAELLGFLESAKKEGAKFVTIKTKTGVKTVPIEQGFYNILSTKDVTGIGIVPNIPSGFTVAGSPGINMVFVPEGDQFVGPRKPKEKDYIANLRSELALDTPIIAAMEQKRLTFPEAVEAIAAPAKGIAQQIAALPTGFYKEITEGRGAGEKYFEKEVEPKLSPTLFGSAITGEPSGRSSAYQKLTVIGDVILYAGTEGIAAVPKLFFEGTRALKVFTKSKARVVPQTQAPPLETRAVIKPTNMFRISGKEIKAATEFDTATPFTKEFVSLGRTPEVKAGVAVPSRDALGGSIIKQIKPVEGIVKPKAVEIDPLYRPKVEVRRAPEPNTFRVDEKNFLGQDTAKTISETKIELGAGPLGKVEVSKAALAGVIIKSPVPTGPIRSQRVELGKATRTTTRVPLGKGDVREIRSGFEQQRIDLGAGRTVQPVKQPGKLSPSRDIFRLAKEPSVQESGLVRGAKDYGNLREQIAGITREKEIKAPKPIEPDTTYSPTKNLPKTRAKEIKTYRIQTDKLIGRTENPLKDIFGKMKEPSVQESGLPKVSIKQTITKVETEKQFPKIFEKKAFERSAIDAEQRREANLYRFTETKAELGKGSGDLFRVNKGKITELPKYEPNLYPEDASVLEKIRGLRRAKEFKETEFLKFERGGKEHRISDPLYDLRKKRELGKREGADIPQSYYDLEKEYFASVDKLNKVYEDFRLGRIGGDERDRLVSELLLEQKSIKTRQKLVKSKSDSFQQDIVGLGRGQVKFIGEGGKGTFLSKGTGLPPRPPVPKEEPSPKPKSQTLVKPVSRFTTTTVELGEAKPVLIVSGGAAVAPIPLIIAAEEQGESNPITNATQPNGTTIDTPVIVEQEQSMLEPPSITQSRPTSTFAAAATTSTGVKYGLGAAQARRQISKVKIIPTQKQKQRVTQAFPEPNKQPVRQAQPSAFKQPQKQPQLFKTGTPFPTPQTPALGTPFPVPERLKTPQLQPPRFPEPPRLPPSFNFARAKESKIRKTREAKPNDFVGNVSDVNVALGFNRKEITSGIERSAKLYKKDTLFAYKRGGFTKFVKQRQGSVLSKKKKSILEREDEKGVKKQKKKTGGFF